MFSRKTILRVLTGYFVAAFFFASGLTVLTGGSSVTQGADAADHEYVAAVPRDFPPHYMTDKNGQPTGFAIEVMDEIARQANIKVTYRIYHTWAEVQQALRSGKADLVPNMGITEERKKVANFTTPYETFRVVCFVRKAFSEINKGEDLKGYSVGVVSFNVARDILEKRTDIDLHIFKEVSGLLFALINKEIDIAAYPEPVFWHAAKKARVEDEIKTSGPPLKIIKRGIAVRKDHKELLALLDEKTKATLKTKKFEKIYRFWLPKGGSPFDFTTTEIFGLVVAALVSLSALVIWGGRGKKSGTSKILIFLRNRFILLVLIMIGVVSSVAIFALFYSYEASFNEQKNRLAETAKNQARLIESIARFDQKYSAFPDDVIIGTLNQIKEGISEYSGSQEITIARREQDTIHFILRQRASQRFAPAPIPFDSPLAAPMRRALSGESGTIIGRDYRNIRVLAAYEPVDILNLGIVAKMDLSKIREPFVRAGWVVIGLALSLTFLGSVIFSRITAPVITRVADSERRYRTLVEGQDDLIRRNLPDTTLLMVNDAYGSFVDRNKDDLPGVKFIEFTPEEFHQRIMDHLASFTPEMPTARQEHPAIRHDGAERWMQWTNTATFDEKGNPVEFVAVGRDITESKQMEKALRQSQKMEAVGQLSGGIAHDFNNMLGVIMGNLDLLRRKVTGDPKAMEYVEMAYEGGERGAKITRKLLSFSREEPGKPQLIKVNDFIKGMKNLIAKSLMAKITVETHLADDIWNVNIDPTDFEDTLLNLSLNARDAMPNGGTLAIESINKTLDEHYVQLNPGSTAGEYVMISVSDTGVGMTPDVLEKAFQPFFSTKDQGQGTGLGLSMVYGFTQRSGGHIKIYSEPGKGSTFRIFLPRVIVGADVNETANAEGYAELPRGDETVLVVDDENNLLKVAVSFLENLGYRTFTAVNGKQALEVLQEKKKIDLLFSDVVMPGGMDGYDIAKEVMEGYPDLKVLLTSGFTAKRENIVNGDKLLFDKLTKNSLSKPYNQSELAIAVRRTLDEEG